MLIASGQGAQTVGDWLIKQSNDAARARVIYHDSNTGVNCRPGEPSKSATAGFKASIPKYVHAVIAIGEERLDPAADRRPAQALLRLLLCLLKEASQD